MEPGIAISVIFFFVGLFIGIPIGWVFLGSAFLGLWVLGDSIGFTATSFFQMFNSEILSAIGFFILAGNLLSVSGLASRIIAFTYALVSKFKGGLIPVVIVGSVFMGALTGSSLPCIAALSPIMVPELEKFGYKRCYTTAVICASSFLGYLIPPSTPALIYCLVAQQSVAALFLSTVIPGLMLATGYIVLNHFMVKNYMEVPKNLSAPDNIEKNTELKTPSIRRSFKAAIPALGCPILILGGIYGGVFTPSEAGAVAVFYTILVGGLIYRELSRKAFLKSVTDAVGVLGMSVILLGGGVAVTRFFLRYGVAQEFAQFFVTFFNSKTLILLSLNVFLLILGMFIDGIPILVLAVPLILPIAKELGVNLVHLGTFVIVNIGIGVITPPFAISIFFGTRLNNVKAAGIIPPIMVYLFVVAIPVLLLTTYIPALSCWLPTLVLGESVVGPW